MKRFDFARLFWATMAVGCFVLACIGGGACSSDESEEDASEEPVTISVSAPIAEPSSPAAEAIEPAMAFDGSAVYLVYCQDDGAADHDLVFSRMTVGGAFSAAVTVLASPAEDSRNPDVALDGSGALHMVWEEGAAPNREIYYATRSASGSISPASNLTNTPGDDEASPRVHVDQGGRVHVLWERSGSIYYRRKTTTFNTAVALAHASGGVDAQEPDLSTDAGDRIYVVWSESDTSTRNIRLLRSDDNGLNFFEPGSTGYAVQGAVDMTEPRVAASLDGRFYLTFIGQDGGGDRGLYVAYTYNGGASFSGSTLLAFSDSGGLRQPTVTHYLRSDGHSTVAVACNNGGASGGEIVVFASHNSGLTWPGDAVSLSGSLTEPATNLRPVLGIDGDQIVATWQAQPTGGGVVRTMTSINAYSLP